MAIRNVLDGKSHAVVDELDDPTTRVLAATRTSLISGSGRRVTLAEIARMAGVSRPTVYRRWPEVNTLIGDTLTREMHQVLQETSWPARSLDDAVNQVVAVARGLRDNELFTAVRTGAPQMLTPYFFDRIGASQQAAITLLHNGITYGQDSGFIRKGDADQMATMVMLIVQSTIWPPQSVRSILSDDWQTELAHAINGYLRSPE